MPSISGPFDVKRAALDVHDAATGLIGRHALDKHYHGELSATGTGEMLSAGTATPGSAGYVAIEKVSGTLAGRSGTFYLQHSGTLTRGQGSLSIHGCDQAGCPQGDAITAAMIDQLTAKVRDGDMRAVRLAMATPVLLGEGGGADGDIAHSFGSVIKTRPEAFLDAALVQNCHRLDYVTTTPLDMTDNDGAQYNELVARRAALASVTRPYLQPLRDEYLAALDRAIVHEDQARFKMPSSAPSDARLGLAATP